MFTGNKHEATKTLDIKEIAALIRTDLVQARMDGELPKGTKFSVRIQRYSGGQSVNVTATVPARVRCTDEETERGRAVHLPKPWLTRVAVTCEAKIEAIIQAYNYDRSDLMCDHFDTRFYAHVRIEEGTLEAPSTTKPTAPAQLSVVPAAEDQIEMLRRLGAL